MSSIFEIKEHVIDASHIREYARATSNAQDEILKLAVKEYIPKDNSDPQPGDVTIIGAHANGFPKVRWFAAYLARPLRSFWSLNLNEICRSCTKLYGKICMNNPGAMASGYEASGSPT
jgi:hypothetical protein